MVGSPSSLSKGQGSRPQLGSRVGREFSGSGWKVPRSVSGLRREGASKKQQEEKGDKRAFERLKADGSSLCRELL